MRLTGKDSKVEVNDIVICYDDNGTGNIPIIFIHGFPFDKSMWESQVEFLKSSFRVITYDLRGFGKSTKGNKTVSIQQHAADLISLMDAMRIEKAIVCGLSMGGYILLNAVNRYSSRFKGIILSDTQCNADSAEGVKKRYQTIEQLEAGGLDSFAETFSKIFFTTESIISKKDLVKRIVNIIRMTSKEILIANLKALAERDETCSTLGKISISTLVLCGLKDEITPWEKSEYMHSNIRKATIRTIDSAAHLSNLEQPIEYNQHLFNFISGLMK